MDQNSPEIQWVHKVYNQSLDQLYAPIQFPKDRAQQKQEALSMFSVMRDIAKKKAPKKVPVVDELGKLCIMAIDGIISDKEFVTKVHGIGKRNRSSNMVMDFLDDLVINQSDLRAPKNPARAPNFWETKNAAWDSPKPQARGSKTVRNLFDVHIPAFDTRSSPRAHSSRSPSFWNVKNSAWKMLEGKAPQKLLRLRREKVPDIWNVKNSAWDMLAGKPSHTRAAHPTTKKAPDFWNTKNAAWDYSFGKKNQKARPKKFQGSTKMRDPFNAINNTLKGLDKSLNPKGGN